MSFDLYQAVTDTIMHALDRGVVPWRSPILGRSSVGMPKNLESGKAYRGINTFLLAFTAYAKGYSSSYWLTFNQAKARGGMVRKGERSSMVVFWKQYRTTDQDTGEEIKVPVLRYYNVFSVEQCEGIEVPDAVPFKPTEFKPIEEAEKIVKGYADGPKVEYGGTRAYYRPLTDTVTLPEPERFASTEEFYSTLYHELAHSSGHSTRLGRKLDTEMRPFGSPEYSKEELIAECGSAFLCAHAGIQPAVIENQAAYIGGWLKSLRDDKRLVVIAAGAAQKAADWIRGIRPTPTGMPEDSQNVGA